MKLVSKKCYSDGDAIVVKDQSSIGASDLSDRHFAFRDDECLGTFGNGVSGVSGGGGGGAAA